MASRGDCHEGRPVTARKQALALSRSLAARARARIAELDQEIDRLQRTEEGQCARRGQQKSPELAGLQFANEADPSWLAAGRAITMRAFGAPVNSRVPLSFLVRAFSVMTRHPVAS
jgi:hypothetical protein